MRFSWKVFICTMIVVAVSFGGGGCMLITSVFNTALNREIHQSLQSNRMIHFAFETAVLNLPSNSLHNYTIIQIFKTLESNSLSDGLTICINDENLQPVFHTSDIEHDEELLKSAQIDTWSYCIMQRDGAYYLHTASKIHVLDRELSLETVNSINSIYEDKNRHLDIYSRFTLVIMLFSAATMLLISIWLTRPIGFLSETAKHIAAGDLSRRVKTGATGEIGILIGDFNQMANALEEKIFQLQEAFRRQEDFAGSFAHELKTPLTAMIGYADMLRSYRLDEEKQFQAANYIFEEGKRLENLSLKLTDIILYQRQAIQKKTFITTMLAEDILQIFQYIMSDNLNINFEKAVLNAEPELLKTILINLIDNARKASENKTAVNVTGKHMQDGYLFTVADKGRGIPPEEISRITEPFYMVDKSRARSQSGVGLGLALCTKIAELHDSKLMIESGLGVGTTVSFLIREVVLDD